MDRDQLIQDLRDGRSFSTEKSPVTGYYVDLRVGETAHGLPVSLVDQLSSKGARLAGTTNADIEREIGKFADQILNEYA